MTVTPLRQRGALGSRITSLYIKSPLQSGYAILDSHFSDGVDAVAVLMGCNRSVLPAWE